MPQLDEKQGREGEQERGQQEQADWREAIAEELDPDADDELLDVTPPDVVAVLGFDPLELGGEAANPKADKYAKGKGSKKPAAGQGGFDWDESKHPRAEKGTEEGGQFVGKGEGGGKGSEKKPEPQPQKKTRRQLEEEARAEHDAYIAAHDFHFEGPKKEQLSTVADALGKHPDWELLNKHFGSSYFRHKPTGKTLRVSDHAPGKILRQAASLDIVPYLDPAEVKAFPKMADTRSGADGAIEFLKKATGTDLSKSRSAPPTPSVPPLPGQTDIFGGVTSAAESEAAAQRAKAAEAARQAEAKAAAKAAADAAKTALTTKPKGGGGKAADDFDQGKLFQVGEQGGLFDRVQGKGQEKGQEKNREMFNRAFRERFGKAFDESEHPRDDSGEWVEKGKGKEGESTSQKRAKSGGEYGPNGEWYKGGAWIATTDLPKMQRQKLERAARGRRQIELGKYEVPPPGRIPIFDALGPGTGLDPHKMELQYQYLSGYLHLSEEHLSQYEDLLERFRDGERYVDANDYPDMMNFSDAASMALNAMAIPGAALSRLASARGVSEDELKSLLSLKKYKPTSKPTNQEP